jgi:1-acyl-sn-glycerol-3-phosphate acyltransferase
MTKYDSFFVGQGRASRLLYVAARAVVVGVTRLFTRLRVQGLEHVPPSGAFVLAPVHRSYIDTPLAAAVTRRRLRFMGKDSLWKWRGPGWVLSALGGFPVSRGSADREALRRCIEVLQAGEPVVLFPEGERKSGPVVQPLMTGATYVAVKAGVPIVPVGIGGSERVMPKGVRLPRPRKVVIIVGEPLYPAVAATPGRAPRMVVRELSAELYSRLQDLFDEADRAARVLR